MNVVGLIVILLSIIPVYLANRLSQDPLGTRARSRARGRCRRQQQRAEARHALLRGQTP